MDLTAHKSSKPLVSVIIPVYNTAAYLEQCFVSLISQTLKNIEIIVIDDGSTDGSDVVCDDFAVRDKRFTVVHRRNEGLSAARNAGLKMAKANYIMFVDSDDWVEPYFCEIPYNIATQYKADLVVFQYDRSVDGQINRRKVFLEEGIQPEKEIFTTLWPSVAVTIWNKLYSRKLFDEISFPVSHFCEDMAVTHRIIHESSRTYLTNDCLYHYRSDRPGSITNNNSSKLREDKCTYGLKRIEDLVKWGYASERDLQKQALFYLIVMGESKDLSPHCIDILKTCSFFTSFDSIKYMLMLYAFRLSPRLFDIFSTVFGKRIK